MKKSFLLSGAICATLALSPLQAKHTRFWSTYDPNDVPPIGSEDWWTNDYALGRWWGARTALYDSGIDFSLTYTNNLAGNPVGGIAQGFTYTDNIYVGAELDLDKLFGWDGGNFIFSVLNRNGTNLSGKYIGNQFTVQQIYGNQTIVWYALLLQQKFWNDRLMFKLGRFSTGDDFASSPLYWLYMNNGIDGNPQALPVNTGFSSYPNAVWGSMGQVKITEEVTAKLGLYQVSPRLGKMAYNGLDWSIREGDGILLITQWGWSPEFFRRPVSKPGTQTSADGKAVVGKSLSDPVEMKGLPGNYWFGAYWSAYNYAQFTSNQPLANSYGFYWHADQMVFQESPGSTQGLTLWSAFVLSPQEAISKLPLQINGGAVYQGLIPFRDQDWTIFGVIYGNFSGDYAQSVSVPGQSSPDYELVFEWGYRVQLTNFAYVQPNIQYVIQPGGRSDIPNALVLGAQIGVTF
jgi:porin